MLESETYNWKLADYVGEIRRRVGNEESAAEVWRDLRRRGVRISEAAVQRAAYGDTYASEGAPPAGPASWFRSGREPLLRSEAREIFRLYHRCPEIPVEVLSDAFSVSKSTIYAIGAAQRQWQWLRKDRIPPKPPSRPNVGVQLSDDDWRDVVSRLRRRESVVSISRGLTVTPAAIYQRLQRLRNRLEAAGKPVPAYLRPSTQRGRHLLK